MCHQRCNNQSQFRNHPDERRALKFFAPTETVIECVKRGCGNTRAVSMLYAVRWLVGMRAYFMSVCSVYGLSSFTDIMRVYDAGSMIRTASAMWATISETTSAGSCG